MDKIQSPETKAGLIAQGAAILAKESPDKAKKLLLRAMEVLKEVTVPEFRLRIAIPSLRAARILGMAEIEQQLRAIVPKAGMKTEEEAKQTASEPDIRIAYLPGTDFRFSEESEEEMIEQVKANYSDGSEFGMLGIAAAALVESDFEAAFALITNRSEMKGIFRPLTDVIISLAEHDPRAAWRQLLEMRPLFEHDNDFIGQDYLAKATKYIALALARTDDRMSLDVARQMSSRVGAKAITLAKIAMLVAEDDKQKALHIFEEASSVPHFMRSGEYPGRWATSARVGHMLSLVDTCKGIFLGSAAKTQVQPAPSS